VILNSTAIRDNIIRIAGHIKNFQGRVPRGQPVRQLMPIHAGHNHVRQQ